MRAYLVASFLFVFYALAHTLGGIVFFDPSQLGPEAVAVSDAMMQTKFDFMGSTCSFNGFLLGAEWYTTLYIVLSALMAAVADGTREPYTATVLGWGLILSNTVNIYLAWAYFFLPPLAVSCLIQLTLILAMVHKQSELKLKMA